MYARPAMSRELDALLDPFFGYVHLKMYDEANEVLEGLPEEYMSDPTVLLARLDLVMAMKLWEEGAVLGQSLAELYPDELEFWFRTAFCLHELKRTQEAKDTAAPRPARDPRDGHVQLQPGLLRDAARQSRGGESGCSRSALARTRRSARSRWAIPT